MISREVKNYSYFKKILENIGYKNLTFTSLEKDALYSLIRALKPDLILTSARYYQCCTPFVMGQIHNSFPKTKIAAVCLGEYPADIAMYFVLNGINSYINSFDGLEQFFQGLEKVANGGEYISPEVLERINLRRDYPEPAGKITERHKQVIELICCGFKDKEIAELLAISRNTVVNHKTELFTSLNVRSPVELVRAALTLEIVKLEELYFYPKDYTLNPLPKK